MSLALLALISFQSTAEASLWSFAGEKAEGETSTNDFVSPIINREISVSVTAPWPSSPANIYCEAFAFLEKWDFLDALVGSSPVPVDTFASATQHAITLASQLSPATDVSLLQFALAMRSKSPTCELHRGLAEQYSLSDPSGQQAFAVFNGKTLITSLEELQKQLASTETSQLTQAEQKALLLPGEVPRSSYGGNNVIVLYANLGSTVFVEWFSVLTKLDVPFVVRFKGTSDQEAESTTPLQGYGVRLDIRNVEYKVFDDRQDTKEEDEVMVNASSVSQKVDNQYLAGVNVSAILDNDEMTNFTLQADLWKLHDAQTLHSQIIPPAWQRRQLSLQAATAIAHSENNELLVLEQVSQNLPSLASTLVHVEIPDQISDAAEKLQDTLSNLIRSSGNLWVNGKPFSLTGSSFNAFELIDLLQKESRVVENLQENFSPTLSQEGIRKVQMAWSQGSSFFLDDGESTDQDTDPEATEKYIRIQLQKGERYSVIYVNNIERDAQYADWPNSMQQMLMMTQYGMPPSVRRNLVTFVSVENPLIEEDVSFGKLLFGQLSQSHFPARLGVVIVDDREVDECSKWLALTSAPEEVPCPVTKSWLDQPDPPKTKKQMEEIRVTARDIHRCYVYMAKTYSDRSDIISQYNSMFGGTLRGNKDGGFINLFVLLNVHAGILEGIGVVNRKEPILIVARDLMNIVEEKEPVTDYSYGMALRYAATKGLKAGMSFMNGRPLPMASDDTGRDLVSKMFVEEQQAIFGMIYNGEINDSSPRSIYRFLIQNSKEKSYPRVHPLLTAGNSDENMIDLTVPRSLDGSNSYIKPSSSKKVGKVDVIFGVDAILDLNTKQGLEIAKTFISIMESISSKKIRGNSVSAGYRILPSTTPPAGFCLILKHGGELGSTVITEILDLTMQKKDWMTELSQGSKTLVAGLPSSDDDKCADWKENEALPSSNFLVVNGQVYNIENSIEKIDLELLMTMITAETKAVTQVLKPHVVDSANLYGVIARTTAFLAVAAKKSGNSRSNPLEMVMKLEKQAGVSNNPLRFTWNDDCEEGALKVNSMLRLKEFIDS
jgi:UDP-glucose:glycoprotein glucosyltransferase